MMKKALFVFLVLITGAATAQSTEQKLSAAVKKLLAQPNMKHATMSLYIADKAGNKVYAINEETGLAAASTQKIFTAIACYDVLGKDFTYNTAIGYTGNIANGVLKGDLIIQGSGDPSLGSFRFASTKAAFVLEKIIAAMHDAGIQKIDGNIILDDTKWSYQPLPRGWIWEDIGNYYGAGTWAINWNENQYDLLLKPGTKENDAVAVTGTDPALQAEPMTNLLSSGKPGSGDNGYIFLSPYSRSGFVEGTVPAGKNSFTLSGSMPYPADVLASELSKKLAEENIAVSGTVQTGATFIRNRQTVPKAEKNISNIVSPSFDSLCYWFLQKSINLYGEAFIKTLAVHAGKNGSTEDGVTALQDFWKQHGIDNYSLNIADGSGLSPQNRVTTKAMVTAMQYARDQSWFNDFYNDLPLYNNMKMKSGTIGGAKAFTGYQGNYVFAIIINNFDNEAGSIVPAMYTVLDALK